jgi:hypothetical protein
MGSFFCLAMAKKKKGKKGKKGKKVSPVPFEVTKSHNPQGASNRPFL